MQRTPIFQQSHRRNRSRSAKMTTDCASRKRYMTKVVLLSLMIFLGPLYSIVRAVTWSTPQEIAHGVRYHSSIAVDAEGNWHVVYDSRSDKYAINYINNSSDPCVVAQADEGIEPDIAIGPNDRLHVIYITYTDGPDGSVMYTNNIFGGVWLPPQEIAHGVRYHSSIAVDADGNWHVVYDSHTGTYYINYVSNTGGPYVVAQADEGIFEPDIAIGPNGRLHVIYITYTDGPDGSVMYTNNISGSWSPPQEIAHGVRYHSSIAVDADGNWHVVYDSRPPDGPYYINYVSNTGGPYVVAQADEGIFEPDIAIGPNGRLHVIYITYTDGPVGSVMYTTTVPEPVEVLEYEWIVPDPPEALMGRNYAVQLKIHNPTEEVQAGSFSLSQEVSSTSGVFRWAPAWQESILLDGSPYVEGSTTNVEVPSSSTLEYYFTINNKWNWINPDALGRLLDISGRILLSWPGFEIASLSYTTLTTLFTYVNNVGEVTYLYTGEGGSDLYEFEVTLYIPYEKQVLYGESVLAGIVGGKLTSAGIAAIFVPGLGWAAAGPLFALEAVEIATGEVAYAFAVDPDQEYMEVINPVSIVIPAVDALDEGPGKQAVLAGLRALSYLEAALASYAKYEAAEDAEDVVWMAIQLELTNRYIDQAASFLHEVSLLLDLVVATVPVPQNEDIETLREWIITNGLPQIEVDTLLALGYSFDDIDAISEATANLPDSAFIMFPDSPQVFSNMAEGLVSAIEAMPSAPNEVVASTFDIAPNILNLKSEGNWVTCYIELVEGYDVSEIDVNSLMLQNSVSAESEPTEIGDYDEDGIPDLMVKFDRQRLIDLLEAGEQIVALTGQLDDGTPIAGIDAIRVIH